MKKIKLILLSYFFLCLFGCEINNIPTSKVEEQLALYQMLEEDKVDVGVEFMINGDEISSDLKEEYVSVVEKQYKSLSYDVKEEVIDGDSSVVSVSIEVMDYKSAIEDMVFNNSNYDSYNRDKLNRIKGVKERVVYTIDFEVYKDSSSKWVVKEFDSDILKKILGIY